MKKHRLVTCLFSLALLTCSRAPTMLVTVENIPPTAQSLQVTATHSELAAIMNLDPLDLPQPAQATATFLLRLPPSFSGDVGVNVGAFKSPGGTGCLVATGSTTTPMFNGPDDNMRVPLMGATDTACTGNPVTLDAVSPGLGSISGGATVTLNGWGYKPGAKVLFGTTAARSVTYVSAAQLQVVTPAKAGFGATKITITNADSSSANRSDLFKFYADNISFTPLPFTNTGDYSNANGFVFGLFNPATTVDAVVVLTALDIVRMLLVTGQVTKQTDYMLPAGSKPVGVVSADFNNDGKLDVAFNTQTDKMVTIMLGDGVGGLAAFGKAAVGNGPEAMASADFDGDGNADLVVANRPDDSITILNGDGQGGFRSQPLTMGSITDPSSIAVADVNFDGKTDIVIANYSSGRVTVLFNVMGTFSSDLTYKIQVPLGARVDTVLLTDTNNDGKIDIVAADSMSNQVVVLQNMGIPNVLKYTIATEASPRSVLAGDLNGDGFPDLIVPCNTPSTVDIFLNDGGHGFNKVVYQSVDAQCKQPVQVAIYDIDRDGRVDVGTLGQGVGLLINQSGL